MKRFLAITTGTVLLVAAVFLLSTVRGDQPVEMKIAAPELQGVDEWINTRPLQLKELRGKVVVLHFWTFG